MFVSDEEEVHCADHVLHGRHDVLLDDPPVHYLVFLVETLPVDDLHLFYKCALPTFTRTLCC